MGTGAQEFGLTVGVGQYVDFDALPDHVRPHVPEEFFDAPADVEPPVSPRKKRASDEVKHGD